MIVLASWDDASAEDVRLADLMAKYEVTTVFYWPVNWELVNNASKRKSLSITEAFEIAKTFEIGSHTVNHPLLTRIPLEVAKSEIVDSKEHLEKMLNRTINSFCYPRGYANDSLRKIVKEAGYTSARNTLVGNIDLPNDLIWMTPTVHIGCQRREYNDVYWLDYAMERLKEAKNKEYSFFHIFGHGWEIEEKNAWKDLETLLKEMIA